MDKKKKWETPKLIVISGMETSEDVLTLQSGKPPWERVQQQSQPQQPGPTP